MDRNKLATLAIVVCMVSAVSTLPAMLIVGGLQPPTVVNYYYTTNPTNTTTTNTTVVNTNTTIYYNGTYPNTTPHFANVTATIPYTPSGTPFTTIVSLPLINRTIVTSVVSFSFNRRPGGSVYLIESRLNGQKVTYSGSPVPEFPFLTGSTATESYYYTLWNNPYRATVYPNSTTYTLDLIGYVTDSSYTTGINISLCVWWETW